MITTTTDDLEGYKITEYLGVVFGFQSTQLEMNDPYSWKPSDISKQADAIIGIRIAIARDGGVSERIMGTAVKIEKI